MEAIFPMLFLGYFMYIGHILYCLIPILAQVVFSSFIEKKQICKVAIMAFLTQGIIVSISQLSYDIIHSIHHCKSLGLWNLLTS